MLSIGMLTKINFKEVDKRFEEFGENFLDAIRHYKQFSTEYEIDYLYESLFDLMMNNISFAKSNLFQDQDIQNMTHKSQLFLLMNGKYFNLLPNPLRKCKDINFKFR